MNRRHGSNRRGLRISSQSPPSGGAPPPAGIVTAGLALHLDAGNVASYPGSGLVWTDLVDPTVKLNFPATGDPGYSSSPGFVNFNSVLTGGTYATGSVAAVSAITTGALEIWFRWKTTPPAASGTLMTTGANWVHLGQASAGESFEFFNGEGGAPDRLAMDYMDALGGTSYFKDNEWHQLVVAVRPAVSAATTIYLDGNLLPPISAGTGVQYRIGSNASEVLWNSATVTIGRLAASTHPFTSDIAIIRMYDRTGGAEFSSAEVAQNYAADSGKFVGFYPDTIDGLTYWLDPDDATTITQSGVADIDVIRDKSFAVPSAQCESIALKRPTVVSAGGRDWMSFDGATQYLQAKSGGAATMAISSVLGSAASGWEMHAIIDSDVAPGIDVTHPYKNTAVIMDSSGYWGIAAKQDPAAALTNVIIQPNSYNGAGATGSHFQNYIIPKNEKHVFGLSYTGGSNNLITYKDGSATTTGCSADIPSNLGGVLQLGLGYSAQYYKGLIGEVCIFNRPLTPTERADLLAYLKAKWGTP